MPSLFLLILKHIPFILISAGFAGTTGYYTTNALTHKRKTEKTCLDIFLLKVIVKTGLLREI
jgi:hypothetical protein